MRRLLLVFPLQVLFLVGAISMLGYLVVSPFVAVYQKWGWTGEFWAWGGTLAFLGLIYGSFKYFDYQINRRIFEAKKDSVFVAWVKAKKARVCPLIDFTK